jgi:hypothetical protein
MVRVEFEGDIIEEPVIEGAYLVVWWRVPVPQDRPCVTAYRMAVRRPQFGHVVQSAVAARDLRVDLRGGYRIAFVR